MPFDKLFPTLEKMLSPHSAISQFCIKTYPIETAFKKAEQLDAFYKQLSEHEDNIVLFNKVHLWDLDGQKIMGDIPVVVQAKEPYFSCINKDGKYSLMVENKKPAIMRSKVIYWGSDCEYDFEPFNGTITLPEGNFTAEFNTDEIAKFFGEEQYRRLSTAVRERRKVTHRE